MANYRPVVTTVASGAVASGVITSLDVSTSTWGMALLKGTALSAGGGAEGSGAILVWESTNPTTTTANHITFTDGAGRYGVTVRAKTQIRIRFYGV